MIRPVRRIAPLLVVAVLLGTLPGAGAPASAQQDAGIEDREQAFLLRQASILESRGEYDEAEQRLRRLLERDPGVAAAVFGLERVLRERGRLPEILPVIDRYLEARPDGSAVRQFELRLLAELDSLDALERAAEEWLQRDSLSLEPYRIVARVFEDAFGVERAMSVIRRGREATGRPTALALEAGDILARGDRPRDAGREWSRAIGEDGRSLSLVLRRIEALPGDTRTVVGVLLEDLEDGDLSAGRLRGAARLALAAGLSDRAVELAAQVVERVDPRTGKGFLVQFARRAEERGANVAALWAYERLRDEPQGEGEARSLDERIAELALATGDTALAVEAHGRIASSRPSGSVERRRALAARLELEVEVAELERAVRRLSEFRSEYPEAPELDGLAAELADRVVSRDRSDLAARVLDGVEGPRSALERAYLRLEDGDVESGIRELEASVDGLGPVRATEVLELLTYLESARPRATELAGRAAALHHRGRTDEALELVRSNTDGVSLDDRPGLLALGARMAEEADDAESAASLRERLVRDFPDAAETPEATVRLARHRAGDPQGDREAARILEELILNRPESAAVPEARRELQKLRERIPGSEG